MKGEIKCPYCGKVLAKHEDVVGRGDLYLFCKRCRKERHIQIATLSLDRKRLLTTQSHRADGCKSAFVGSVGLQT